MNAHNLCVFVLMESKKKSLCKATSRGICQGQSTSNFYFSIYVNDLPLVLEHTDCFLFVDDNHIAICGEPSKINDLIPKLQSDLCKVNEWMMSNKMQVNIDKCNFIIFGKASATKALHDVTLYLNNVSIQKCVILRILGVMFDENLTFDAHVKLVIKKCYASLSKVQSYKRILSTDIKKFFLSLSLYRI